MREAEQTSSDRITILAVMLHLGDVAYGFVAKQQNLAKLSKAIDVVPAGARVLSLDCGVGTSWANL